MFLWFVPNIKVSVTAPFLLGKCRIEVIVSVFWDTRESMELLCDERCLRDNAVSLYLHKIPHFTLDKQPKVFKNNV